MSDIILTKGRKAEGDVKIHWPCKNCGNLYSPKFIDVIKWLVTAFENEDRIYPPSKGYRGRDMLKDAIEDYESGMCESDLLFKYKL